MWVPYYIASIVIAIILIIKEWKEINVKTHDNWEPVN